MQIPLLDYGGREPYYEIVSDERISATSHLPYHPPHEARWSGKGWCADRVDTGTVESAYQYLQVDFGAELIVQAIFIGNVNGSFHVSRYFIEYGSDANYFESDRTQLYCGDPDSVSFDKTTVMHKKSKLSIASYTI